MFGVVILAVAGVYLRTGVYELLPYDGGEFQELSIFGGHSHVTGYPIYMALVRAFAWLPLGDEANRATAFSAVMGGVAAGLAYITGRLLSGWRLVGLAMVLAWSGNVTVWSQAVQAEVYTTAAVFTAGVMLAVICWLRDRRPGQLALGGLLGGASLGVHGSIGLFAVGVVFALLLAGLDWRNFWAAAAGTLLGVFIYFAAFWLEDHGPRPHDVFANVYQPWAAAYGTDQAHLAGPWQRMAFLLEARQWQKSMFAAPMRAIPRNAYWYLRAVFHEFTFLWIGLSIAGVLLAIKRARPLAVLLVVGSLVHHYFVFNYEIRDLYIFFLPAYFYLSAAASFCAGPALEWCARRSRAVFATGVVLLALAAGGAQTRDKLSDLRTRDTTNLLGDLPPASELATERSELEDLLGKFPANAFVGANWSCLYRLIYLAQRQGRPDLQFVEPRPWGIEHIAVADYRRRLAALAAGRPIVLDLTADELTELGLRGRPLGRYAGEDFWLIDAAASGLSTAPNVTAAADQRRI